MGCAWMVFRARREKQKIGMDFCLWQNVIDVPFTIPPTNYN